MHIVEKQRTEIRMAQHSNTAPQTASRPSSQTAAESASSPGLDGGVNEDNEGNEATASPIPADDSREAHLHRLNDSIAGYPELSKKIVIKGEYAFGILEQAKFTSSFSEIFEIDATDVNVPVEDAHPAAHTWLDALPRKTRGWRGSSVAFDSTAVLVSSTALFAKINQSSLLVSLDRLTRTLHAMNFAVAGFPGVLFLPVHERLLTHVRHDHGKYFSAVLLSLGLNPAHVVIEIPPVFTAHPDLLAYIATNYRRHGFKVALQLSAEAVLSGALPPAAFDYVVPELDEEVPIRALEAIVSQAQARSMRVVVNSPTSVASSAQQVINSKVFEDQKI
jgi:hypothetical protein